MPKAEPREGRGEALAAVGVGLLSGETGWEAGFRPQDALSWSPPASPSVSPTVVRVGSDGAQAYIAPASSEERLEPAYPTFLFHPQVFFTRNGKIIGKKDAVVPSGGFFPTIGMLSCGEKVKVDLHPLSG